MTDADPREGVPGLTPPSTPTMAPLQLYIEHLQQRLAQAEMLRIQISDLEAEKLQLRNQVNALEEGWRQELNEHLATTRAYSAKLDHYKRTHVSRDAHQKTRAQLKNVERRLRAVQSSRSYRLGRAMSKVFRAVVPAKPGERRSNPDPAKLREAPSTRRSSQKPASQSSTSRSQSSNPAKMARSSRQDGVLLDLRGYSGESLASILTEMIGRLDGLTPVVVQTSLDFRAARESGMRVEYIPKMESLAANIGDALAERVVETRWNEILEQYQPVEIYRHDSDGINPSGFELVWFSTSEVVR